MILETGKANSSAYSLRSQLGISSGPHTFDGFSVASSFIILSSDTSCSFGESVGTGNLVNGCSKRYSLSGSRKAWLRMFASSWLLQSSSSSMWMWLMTLPELDWDPLRRLTSFHHSFNLEFHFSCAPLWPYRRRLCMIFIHDLLCSYRTWN